ncbi:hypothetical protein ACJJTC_007824 [Scirpophaga incertulas]
MFSTKAQLLKRTPQNGTDRENFLSLLVDEYLNTTSYDAKCQVLANLANFAYDPVNYEFIRKIGVLDIFLYIVKNDNDCKLLLFSTAGISNLSIDPVNIEYIQTNLGLGPLINLLDYKHNEVVANIITILMNLYNDKTISEIKSSGVRLLMENYSKSDDKILSNLATIFHEVISIN